MARLDGRLARLEKALREVGSGACSTCGGHPPALIYVNGERGDMPPHLTEDGRCPACGREAAKIHFVTPGYRSGVRGGP